MNDPTSVMNELVEKFMAVDNTKPRLYFLPYNSGHGLDFLSIIISF